MKIVLCANCLDRVKDGYIKADQKWYNTKMQIGGEIGGSQRDPEYAYIDLCAPCGTALQQGDLRAFHDRYREDRTIDARSMV